MTNDALFGYLVLVFATPHEGGQLTLRHEGHSVMHDGSSSATANVYSAPNQVSWVAFFSDVEHEVLPVLAGHRVTLTYNLYYGERRVPITRPMRHEPVAYAFRQVLADLTFFPDGGRLGFALKHAYNVPESLGRDDHVDLIPRLALMLRGCDQALFSGAQAAGLAVQLMLVYDLRDLGTYLLETPIARGTSLEKSNWEEIMKGLNADKIEWDATEIEYRLAPAPPESEEQTPLTVSESISASISAASMSANHLQVSPTSSTRRRKSLPKAAPDLVWISPWLSTHTHVESEYIKYGRKASLGTTIGELVIVVKIPSKENRAAV